MIRRLEWDSEFFGIRIGRIAIRTEDDLFHFEQERRNPLPYDLIYIFDERPSGNVPDGARLVDTKVVYAKSLADAGVCASDKVEAYRSDVPDNELYGLALVSGAHSRYKTDSAFPAGSFERLYRKWVENSVSGEIADAVLCYVDKGSKKGMLSLKCDCGKATIGLIAVDPDSQSKGIGTVLMRSAETFAAGKGTRTLEVATQLDNEGACRFYEKNGYKMVSSTRIYHLWI